MSQPDFSSYLAYYATPSEMSTLPPSFIARLLPSLQHPPRPSEIPLSELLPTILQTVQSMIVHPMLMHIYPDVNDDVPRVRMTSNTQDNSVNVETCAAMSPSDPETSDLSELGPKRAAYDTSKRTCTEMCARIAQLDFARSGKTRDKFVGVCRHFSLLTVAILRHLGIPARARCGFAGYFSKQWEDHWIVEVWDPDMELKDRDDGERKGGWQSVDSQLDPVLLERLKVDWSPFQVPRTMEERGFITGTEVSLAFCKPTEFASYPVVRSILFTLLVSAFLQTGLHLLHFAQPPLSRLRVRYRIRPRAFFHCWRPDP